MDMKEKLLAEMEQSDFAKNNGKIMRTLNVLAPSYHNLSSIQRILKDDGIGEGQYAACLDFLALEGYILLRTVKDHVRCEDLADHNWTELEAKLSGKGLEIGPLHRPMMRHEGMDIDYIDRCTVEELRRHYPELCDLPLVEPTICFCDCE